MHVLPVGRDAVLVEVATSHEAVALAGWARDHRLARDVVPGAVTVLLDGVRDVGSLPERLTEWSVPDAVSGPEVEVAVTYDGPDLGFVADHWGCTVDEVVRRHRATAYESAFCGFTPGFAYLRPVDAPGAEPPQVPRLATPRTRVPAGAVGLAGPWCGIYPVASPGGWRLIGRTEAVLWDAAREQPALLSPGTRVRFVAAP